MGNGFMVLGVTILGSLKEVEDTAKEKAHIQTGELTRASGKKVPLKVSEPILKALINCEEKSDINNIT